MYNVHTLIEPLLAMHITKIELENIKSLAHFIWELGDADARAGWHVFLGDNGAGKS
ncbi:MAG: hypothetical protein RL748_3615, partial [Pseudomonadota bacterium]